jgi:long-chain acyl-CoA synthetase
LKKAVYLLIRNPQSEFRNTKMKYPNIYSLFCERVEHYRGRDAFFVRRGNRWEGISWERFDREAHQFASALIASGLSRGGSVAILMGNVPAWPVSDLGTIIAGGVSVGLYPTSSAEQCRYIINHSDAEFVLVDTATQLEKILRAREGLPKLKSVIVLDESAARVQPGVMSYREFLLLGAERLALTRSVMEAQARQARPEDIVIMVYTSGTTGRPKGACLSHRYVINSVESLRETIPMFDSDVSFSYLPYCHVAERISGLYNRLYAGAAAYFVEDMRRLWDYMPEVKPTVFASLPRFFEKVHARVMSDLEQATAEERARFAEAHRLGKQVNQLRQEGAHVPEALREEYEEKSLPVRAGIKEYFGGQIRLATSGGASLPQEIAEFFAALGIPILQAYGLTENLCVAFNRPDNYKFGTVGPTMPGCSVKIAQDGEIQVRSEMMFSGYYKEPDQTAEVFRDGWLLTGDLGEMDADGFLRITGRKKELIVTSTGKNIAPALIENLLKEHHLISHALAYGDGKSYLVALITLNPLEMESFARAHEISYRDFAELTRSDAVSALVSKMVEEVNGRVSATEAIRKFAILDRDFSVEAEEITPTMKIKRQVVTERYRDILEGLYD